MPSDNSSRSELGVKQLFISDIRYSTWATQRLLDACLERTIEELERNLKASHASILKTLQHACDGERVWLDCLSTTVPGGNWQLPTEPAPKLTIGELRHVWPSLWNGYEQWVQGLAHVEIELGAEVFVKIPDGSVPGFTRWNILRHVLDHSQFHRGQVVAMIRILGHTPPAINRGDYWLAGGSDGMD